MPSTQATDQPMVLILAAGRGTRMKSNTPKVLHKILGQTMIESSINAAKALNPCKIVLVTGFQAQQVEQSLHAHEVDFVRQKEQLGTGHAVLIAEEYYKNLNAPLVIMPGDAPLISSQTLMDLVSAHQAVEADLSVLTVKLENPASYGRIVRDQKGWLKKIVEAKDASKEELSINEINSGFYVVNPLKLLEALKEIKTNNKQNEYYLTDIVEIFNQKNYRNLAVETFDTYEVQGVNDKIDLANCQNILKKRINQKWMKKGVTILDPENTYIELNAILSPDVVIWPHVVITGLSVIEQGAEIKPFCHIENSTIKKDCQVESYTHVKKTMLNGNK